MKEKSTKGAKAQYEKAKAKQEKRIVAKFDQWRKDESKQPENVKRFMGSLDSKRKTRITVRVINDLPVTQREDLKEKVLSDFEKDIYSGSLKLKENLKVNDLIEVISDSQVNKTCLSFKDSAKVICKETFSKGSAVKMAKDKRKARRKHFERTSDKKFQRDINNGLRMQKRQASKQFAEKCIASDNRRESLRCELGNDLITSRQSIAQATICTHCLKINKSVSRFLDICSRCGKSDFKRIEICAECFAPKKQVKTVIDGIKVYSAKCKCRKSEKVPKRFIQSNRLNTSVKIPEK